MYCNLCGIDRTGEEDIEAIREWGFCLVCDKLNLNAMEENETAEDED